MRVLIDCLKKNKIALLLFAAGSVFNGAVFFLYNLMNEAFVYSEALLFVLLFILLTVDFLRENKKAKQREQNKNTVLFSPWEESGKSLSDADYAEMIFALQEEIKRLKTEFSQSRRESDDYYTTWVHQIKTPIAVMKLTLANDSEEHRALLAELFRMEQYVEMVLDYIRLGSQTNDLVIKEYPLDGMIKESLRKLAPLFVLRKLKLNYEPTNACAVTDKKWFCFILEQFLTNAVKYTPSGEITVSVKGNAVSVSDTGIGIAFEDLPVIFEKGYTGHNGRLGQKSSGLGLFLTKKAAALLSAEVTCESTVGKGSTFTVILPKK